MGKQNKKLMAALLKARENDPNRVFQKLPKPPSHDGVCACGCCHKPDRGPCPRYHQAGNDRCAVCDHGILCHRRKGEPPPKDWNVPLKLPLPRADLLPPSAFICPDCEVSMIRCSGCKCFVPLKSLDSGFHIANCPTCGHFDLPCLKQNHEHTEKNKTGNP